MVGPAIEQGLDNGFEVLTNMLQSNLLMFNEIAKIFATDVRKQMNNQRSKRRIWQ